MVAIAGVVSLLPLAVRFFTFFWFPGTVVALMVLGKRILYVPSMVRVVTGAIVWSMVLYFGAELWYWAQSSPRRPITPAEKAVLIFWVVLMVPWLLVAPLAGMAFDSGYTTEAYAFAWSIWAYPIAVGLAVVLRKWVRWAVLLPVVNFVGCFGSELLHK